MKIKDFVLVALLTALYMVMYFISMIITSFLGAFGHAISPGICGLLSGALFYFMTRKVGKMWQFTIMIVIVMGIFAMMGGGYLPWILSSMVTAIMADFIASRNNRPSVLKVALASGLIHTGSALGAIIPATFFVKQYVEEWINRGQSEAHMLEMVKYTSGALGLLSTVITFGLAFAGAYIGYVMLRKHLKEA